MNCDFSIDVPEGEKKPTRMPVAFSAFVLPGVGQCMQRRWLAGVFYAVTFMVSLGFLVYYAARIMFLYYNAWETDDAVFERGGAMGLLVVRLAYSFATAMCLYFANILDAHRAYRHALNRWLSSERQHRLENSLGEPPPSGR